MLVSSIKSNMAVDDAITKVNIKIFSDFFQEPPTRVCENVPAVCSQAGSHSMEMFPVKICRCAFTSKVNDCTIFFSQAVLEYSKKLKNAKIGNFRNWKLGPAFQKPSQKNCCQILVVTAPSGSSFHWKFRAFFFKKGWKKVIFEVFTKIRTWFSSLHYHIWYASY